MPQGLLEVHVEPAVGEEGRTRDVAGHVRGEEDHRADHVVSADSWNYAAILYDEDIAQGTLDLSVVTDQLIALGIIGKDDYLMDVELGAEIVNGSGWLDIHRLSITRDGQSSDLVTPDNLGKLPQ